jgi:hypothetical protein
VTRPLARSERVGQPKSRVHRFARGLSIVVGAASISSAPLAIAGRLPDSFLPILPALATASLSQSNETLVAATYFGLPGISFLCCVPLFLRRAPSVRVPSLLLASATAVGSLLVFFDFWSNDVAMARSALASAAMAAITASMLAWSRSRPSFSATYAFHVSLFLWLWWFAFPWLGADL